MKLFQARLQWSRIIFPRACLNTTDHSVCGYGL